MEGPANAYGTPGTPGAPRTEADRSRRARAAWLSYLGIQAIWTLLVLSTPLLAANLEGPRLLGLPFCCVTAANGLHLSYFRGEYGELFGRAAALVPFSGRLRGRIGAGGQQRGVQRGVPSYCLPLGVCYALAGVGGALGILLA